MFKDYADRLGAILHSADWSMTAVLAEAVAGCWRDGRQVFLCGNGGSAGNALHIANDLIYGCACNAGRPGIRAHALPANPAVLTCLANDVGYDAIFSIQLATHARPGDLLIVLSGSGNSANIVKALEAARQLGLTSAAILGYSGGKALALADIPVHFAVDDMQISEDLQLVVGHMIMQQLRAKPPEFSG